MTNKYLFGYARVSTKEQNADSQVDALVKAGCAEERIFVDFASGTRASRPQWDELLSRLRSGDHLVITKLDRAGRSVQHLVTMLNDLAEREVDLSVIDQGIDTSSPAGRMFFHMLAAIAEFEHDLIVERVRAGLAAARARGRRGGRPRATTATGQAEVQRMYDERELTVGEIAALMKCSRATVYRVLRRDLGDRVSDVDVSRIRDLYADDDWSVEQIASDMGFSVALVRRSLCLEPLRSVV